MIPQKSKSLCNEVAEELNLPVNLVEDLIEYYYKEIKSNITGLKHLRINVEALGQFVIKENFVRKTIPKYKKALTNHDTSTFNAYHNKLMLEKKLIALENIEKQLDKLKQKKEDTENKKQAYQNSNKNDI
jgi:nucleoid DNA-binding protein